MFNVAPKKDEIVGGKYVIKAGELIIVMPGYSHLDKKVYGEDVKEFHPDRMLDENFEQLNKEFPNCWKPFGNGARACIGRPFAWQEALLVVAMMFQNFDFALDDPEYKLKIKQTLTVKPDNFKVKATIRNLMTATQLEQRLAGITIDSPETKSKRKQAVISENSKPLSIYYGSNSGTCKSMAELLASDAIAHGFHATTVESLDTVTEKIPTDQPVVFITASYEGQAPDNAAKFIPWLEGLDGQDELQGVNYAVFGCGNRDWTTTFHRIPRLVDTRAVKHGANRLAPLGLTDVSQGNEMTDFEAWEDEHLWPALIEKYDAVAPVFDGESMSVEVTTPRKDTLHQQDVKQATVIATRTLTAPTAPGAKKHAEIKLPPGLSYKAGDYLAILPVNPRENINRVMRHFHLSRDAHLTISGYNVITLPENVSIPAAELFGSYVELAQPATKRNILSLAEEAQDGATKEKLTLLATDDLSYVSEIIGRRMSVLDLLEANPNVSLPISSFLKMLPPLRVRQYSISSSPLTNPDSVVLTYSVLDEPSISDEAKRYQGVATNYLSGLETGDVLHVSVRPSHAAFHLPGNMETTPVIMIAAGTGIAPFRGFVQERAALKSSGGKLAAGLLYFGCRQPDQDDLYKSDLDKWEAEGSISVKRAYSRATVQSEDCKYVQDRLWKDRDLFMQLWNQNAMVYICGGKAFGDGVKDKIVDILVDGAKKQGKETKKDDMKSWFDSVKNVRYAVDLFD